MRSAVGQIRELESRNKYTVLTQKNEAGETSKLLCCTLAVRY
jgi:hypothetical protein